MDRYEGFCVEDDFRYRSYQSAIEQDTRSSYISFIMKTSVVFVKIITKLYNIKLN